MDLSVFLSRRLTASSPLITFFPDYLLPPFTYMIISTMTECSAIDNLEKRRRDSFKAPSPTISTLMSKAEGPQKLDNRTPEESRPFDPPLGASLQPTYKDEHEKGWQYCMDTMEHHDMQLCKRWSDELNNLLVFVRSTQPSI